MHFKSIPGIRFSKWHSKFYRLAHIGKTNKSSLIMLANYHFLNGKIWGRKSGFKLVKHNKIHLTEPLKLLFQENH